MRCSKVILVRQLLMLTAFALFASTVNAFDLSTQGGMVPVFEPDYTTTWDGGTIHTDNNGIAPNVPFVVFNDRVMLKADGDVIALTAG